MVCFPTGSASAWCINRQQAEELLALQLEGHRLPTHQEVLLEAVAPAAARLVGQRGVKVHIAAGRGRGEEGRHSEQQGGVQAK